MPWPEAAERRKRFISSYPSRSQDVIEGSQHSNRCRSCGVILLVGFILLLMLSWPNCVGMVPSTVAWTLLCKPSIKTILPDHRQIWWQQWLNWGSLFLVSLGCIKLTITNQYNHQLVLKTYMAPYMICMIACIMYCDIQCVFLPLSFWFNSRNFVAVNIREKLMTSGSTSLLQTKKQRVRGQVVLPWPPSNWSQSQDLNSES